jgi:hypothetical protein
VSRGGEDDSAVRRGEEECATVDVEGVINRDGSAGTLNRASDPAETLRVGVVAREETLGGRQASAAVVDGECGTSGFDMV